MSLLQMSFSGGVLILAITVVRALALNKLPKRAFLVLWGVAALRLLVPFSIASPVSVYALAGAEIPERLELESGIETVFMMPEIAPAGNISNPAESVIDRNNSNKITDIPAEKTVWLTGVIACAAFFTVSYVRCRRKFRSALPVENAEKLLSDCQILRPVSLRRCDIVAAPLTYGVFHPVILLPASMDLSDGERLAYVLEHEMVHIRRFDALWKLAFTAAACVHWFNPPAWVMYALANRDLELSCDEAVVRRFGLGKRSAYAMTLIHMEETKNVLPPLASGFSRFGRNAMEERIIAVMKLKKTSVLAVVMAAVLVFGLTAAFATSASASAERPEDLRVYLKDMTYFSGQDGQRLLSLWFDGYEDMTVSDYQKKIWAERDNPEDMELLERFSQSPDSIVSGFHNENGNENENKNENKNLSVKDMENRRNAFKAFENYYFFVCEPLTRENWWKFRCADAVTAAVMPNSDNNHSGYADYAVLEYNFELEILDADRLKVGEYEKTVYAVMDGMQAILDSRTGDELRDEAHMYALLDAEIAALEKRLSTDRLKAAVPDYTFRPLDPYSDADLAGNFSAGVNHSWDELLAPYAAFGLTWEFDDPDLDGNGLKMYWQGREVRGIMDEQEHIWLTEHTGNSVYAANAIELYMVYTDGKLAGLRPATAEEQARWDDMRRESTARVPVSPSKTETGTEPEQEQTETREFPHATEADYTAFLELMKWENRNLPPHASAPYRDYQDMPLSAFNQRLLDWGNENPDAYDRIFCDALWDDFDVELNASEKRFVTLTCRLSGTENAAFVRSSYTGLVEEDYRVSRQFPFKELADNGIMTAWCELYVSFEYRIPDKSAVTVRERDRCVSGVMDGVQRFWEGTGLDTLLGMSESDVVAVINRIAGEYSGDALTIMPVTVDGVHFEAADEREVYR